MSTSKGMEDSQSFQKVPKHALDGQLPGNAKMFPPGMQGGRWESNGNTHDSASSPGVVCLGGAEVQYGTHGNARSRIHWVKEYKAANRPECSNAGRFFMKYNVPRNAVESPFKNCNILGRPGALPGRFLADSRGGKVPGGGFPEGFPGDSKTHDPPLQIAKGFANPLGIPQTGFPFGNPGCQRNALPAPFPTSEVSMESSERELSKERNAKAQAMGIP